MDAKVAQIYAELNRMFILSTLIRSLGISSPGKDIPMVESVHNYIDIENKIIRKGAIAAYKGQKVIIPFNMRDGMVIATGKGNEDWNCSAPHGAGRIMGRGVAKRTLSMVDFKESMRGIYSTCVTENTLDEAPMVYKNKDEILKLVEPTITKEPTLLPVYNFKAEEKRRRRGRGIRKNFR
jgi:RNA-splicing ligase RtcB